MDSNGRNRSSPLPPTSTPPLTTLNTIPVSTSTSAFRRIPSLARPFRRNTDRDKDKEKEKGKEKEKERINEEEPTTGNGPSSSTSSPSHSRTLTFPSLSRVLGESSSSTSTSTTSGPERHSQSDQVTSTQPRTSSLPLPNSSPNRTPPLSPFPNKGSMKEAMISALAPPVPILSSQNMDDMEPITYPSHLAQRLPPEAGPSSTSSTPPPSTPGTGSTSVYSTPNPAPTWPRSSNRIRETNVITPRRNSDLERDRIPTANLEYGPEPGPGGPPTGVPRRKESMSGSRSGEQNALRATPNGENREVSVNGKTARNSGTDTDSGGNDTNGAVGRKRATTKSAVDNKRDPTTTASTTTPLPLSIDKEKEKEGTGRTRKTSRPARTPTYIAHPTLPCAKSMSPVAASSMYFSLLPYHGRPPTQALRAHTGTLVGNRIWLIGGVDSKHCWRGVAWYDTESLLWSTVETAGESLPPLRAHTTTAVGTRLYIFGGGDGPTYSNDVWVFDTVTHRFSRPEIATPRSSLPPPRRAHTTVLYRNFLVIFGGGNGQTALNDVWALDISDPSRLTWEEWPTQGEAPARKGYHTANLVGDKMIVFGGSDGHASFADVHVLNLRTLVWTTVITDIKHNRLSHTSTQVGSYLFILGGHNGQSYAQDVLLFNLVTLQWESKTPKGQAPPGRGYHVALLHDARIFISGGYNGVSVFDDLWVLDLSAAAYLPQVTTFEVDETRTFNQDIPA